MSSKEFNSKIGSATRWSALTEVVAKMVTPVSMMILARLLAPEAFGVVAMVMMVVSFADIFTDAGFQKYLVQRDFEDGSHKNQSTNVAFWTNITISLLLWALIILFREQIAIIVGNPGLGVVIAVACIQLPINSFSSIQMALFRRDFDFKALFLIRMIAIAVPFVITIPLAWLGWNYWALIWGTISGGLVSAIILTWQSRWRPQLYYNFGLLNEMLSFSIWSMIEAISIWFTAWVDIFVIGSALSVYYLGLYRTSLTMVNSILFIVTSATTPILFAALSRLQSDESAFNVMFFRMQKMVAYLVFPMGAGIYLYKDVVTSILLGDQWTEASRIIGVWALTSTLIIVLSYYCSEVYRSKGLPRLSFRAQMLHLLFLVPTLMISIRYGFWALVYARALIRFQTIIVHAFIMKYSIGFPIEGILPNIQKPFLYTLLMSCGALGLQQISSSLGWSLVSILLCVVIYIGMVWFFDKQDFKMIEDMVVRKRAVD